MPGVPSGRGCDACRKQKKKCDQAKPACARCKRLRIACTGSGQQRFKFINQSGPDDWDSLSSSPPEPQPLTIIRVPASQSDLIAGNMFSRLRVTDARYDTSCFGAFLRFIPERIGSNQALDAATDAFSTAFTNVHIPNERNVQALVKHGNSLKALRDSLGHPTLCASPETGCAIYLVMLTEGLVRDEPGRHIEGIALLLQTLAFRKWTSRFEFEMLNVMCFTVIMESVGNPNLRLDPWMRELLDMLEPRHRFGPGRNRLGRFPSLDLRFLAGTVEPLREPWNHYEELLNNYEELRDDLERIQDVKWERVAEHQKTSPGTLPTDKAFRLCNCQLSLSSCAVLAHVKLLQQFDPEDTSLREASESLIQQLIECGEQAIPYKPLGASHVSPGLSLAWAAAGGQKTRDRIDSLHRETFNSGFPAADRMREPRWWLMKFADTREQIVKARSPRGLGPEDEEREILRNQCRLQ